MAIYKPKPIAKSPGSWEEVQQSPSDKVRFFLEGIVPIGSRVRVLALDVDDETSKVKHYYADHVGEVGTVEHITEDAINLFMDFNQDNFMLRLHSDQWEVVHDVLKK